MILGRNLLTGHLMHSTGTPICRSCWNGNHHNCTGQADSYNKCECATWSITALEHAEGSLFKEMRS